MIQLQLQHQQQQLLILLAQLQQLTLVHVQCPNGKVTIGVMMKTTPQNVIMMVVTAADAMSGQNIAMNVNARTPIQYVRTAQAHEDATSGRGGVGTTDLG